MLHPLALQYNERRVRAFQGRLSLNDRVEHPDSEIQHYNFPNESILFDSNLATFCVLQQPYNLKLFLL